MGKGSGCSDDGARRKIQLGIINGAGSGKCFARAAQWWSSQPAVGMHLGSMPGADLASLLRGSSVVRG